nr:hypothetical protein [Tanacetum cinerariifolium]
MGKRILIVSTKEVVQPAESTNQGQNISSNASDEASDPSVDKSILQEIWNLASDEKVLVAFNELCQAIRDEGNKLTIFLGTLVRMPQHIGIHYPEWRKVPKEKKDDLWSIIKVESERKKINRLKSFEPHVTWTKSFTREKDEEADIKAIGDSSSIDQETTNNSDWTNDDLSKVKGPERRGLVRAKKRVRGPTKKKEIWNLVSDEKVLVTFNELCQPIEGNKLTNFLGTLVRMPQHIGIHYPEWRKADIKAIVDSSSTDQETTNNSDWTNDDLSKVKGPERRGSAQVKYLRQGFMMFAAVVQKQVPNLNLSSVMNFMNMEADGLSSIHDNTIDRNPNSASVLLVKESTVQKSALKKSGGSRHHTSVSIGDKSGVHDITINKSGVDHHTSRNKSDVHDSLSKLGNKLGVHDTHNKSGTSFT